MTQEKLGWSQRLGWASGDIGINFYWKMIGTFLYFFYTDLLGISPFWAGIAFGIGTLWDGLCDPIVGAIADRTRTRHGRFRPFLLYLSLPCAVAFVLAFWKPPLEGDWLVAYAIVTHIIFRTLFTAIGVAYGALSARMATDSNERGTLAALRMMAAALGNFVVSLTLPKMLASSADPQTAYLIATSLLGTGATIILLICFATTREAIEPELDDVAPPVDSVGDIFRRLGRDMLLFWRMLRHNVPLRQLLGSLTVSSIAMAMFDKCWVYWYKYNLGDIEAMGIVMSAAVLPFLAAVPFWTWVSRRTSKRAVWLTGTVLNTSCFLIFYFVNPHDMRVLLTLASIMAAGGAANFVMFWAMLPDTVEYNEWKLGERAEARIFGFSGLAQKAALAVNALILGQALEWAGFVPGQAQSAATLDAMMVLMCLVPVAGGIATFLIMWRYPLSARRHAEIVEEIRARAHMPRAAAALS